VAALPSLIGVTWAFQPLAKWTTRRWLSESTSTLSTAAKLLPYSAALPAPSLPY
jgi:hypothetical protein